LILCCNSCFAVSSPETEMLSKLKVAYANEWL
jgi:hypothetical protein